MSDFVKRKKIAIEEFESQSCINNGWTYFLNDLKESLDYIKLVQSDLEKLRAENEAFRKTLEFYRDIKNNHTLIFDNETDSRAEVYEKYKEYSIGDMGFEAAEVLHKYQRKAE